MIFTPQGDVITNHHVAGNAKQIICTLMSKEEVDADLIGTDPLTDISVIRLRPTKPREFPVAKFGDSSALRVGDHVMAMGSPLALSQSVTLGIVSNTTMVMPDIFGPNRMELEGEDVGSMVRWIGHDAAITGGNSGGPLVNLQGEVVGINEISYGLSGAIPGNLALHRRAGAGEERQGHARLDGHRRAAAAALEPGGEGRAGGQRGAGLTGREGGLPDRRRDPLHQRAGGQRPYRRGPARLQPARGRRCRWARKRRWWCSGVPSRSRCT